MNFKRLENWPVDTTPPPWLTYGLLILITILAAAFRFYKLGEWSFWIDEIYTINHAVAHYSTWGLILDHIPPNRNWVPVSVILTAQALNNWGTTEWSARLASVFIGTVSIPALYFPTRRMFGVRIALIAILLLAVSPWHLFWSQNARFYTSLLLFYSLALAAFHFGIERNKPGYFIAFYVLIYLALSERLFAFFIFPVIGVYLFALWIFKFEKPLGLNSRSLILLGLPLIAGGAIEIYSRIASGSSRFFADFGWFFLYKNDDPVRLLGNISFYIGIPLMTLALFSGFFLILRKNRAGLLITVNAVVPVVLLVAANPFIFTKDRYGFIVLFSWIVLAAIAIHELLIHVNGLHKWIAIGILMIFLADASGENLLYYQANHGNRAEWKTAFYIIQERSEPDDIVVTYWPEFRSFYLDKTFLEYELVDIPTILNSRNRFWFVIDSETIWANPDLKGFLEGNAELIDVRYLRTPDDFFLRIYLFEPEQSSIPSYNPEN